MKSAGTLSIDNPSRSFICGENGKRDTAGKSHDNGVGNELNDGSQAEAAHQDQYQTGHESGYRQSFQSVGLYNAVHDNDKCSGRSAYLHAVPA